METCELKRYITSTKEHKWIKRCWSGAVVSRDGVQKYDYFVFHACVVMWLEPVRCSSWRHMSNLTAFPSIFLFSVQSFTLSFRVGQTVQFLSFMLMSCLSLKWHLRLSTIQTRGAASYSVSVCDHILLRCWFCCCYDYPALLSPASTWQQTSLLLTPTANNFAEGQKSKHVSL